MCHVCDKLSANGMEIVNELLSARRRLGVTKPDLTPTEHTMRTATLIVKSIDPKSVKEIEDLCLALGAAVERIVTMELEKP